MTYGTLQREIPVLEPDEGFIDRLTALAAASRPSRGGVVVPIAFGGPAARAVAVAAAVAAVTAGAAAAASQLSHATRPEPAAPGSSVGIQRPAATPAERAHHAARPSEPDTMEPPAGTRGPVVSVPVVHTSIAADPAPPIHHVPGDHQGGPTGEPSDNPTGDGSGDNGSGDGQGDNGSGNGSGDNSGDSSGNGSGDNSGNGSGDSSGSGSGDNSGNTSGDTSGGGSGNSSGNGDNGGSGNTGGAGGSDVGGTSSPSDG